MSEPRHENPLDFFRNALGDSIEKQSQCAIMENKIFVLETQNELLKTQNAKLATLQDILEKFIEKMTVDEEYLESETQIVEDVEMCNSNDEIPPVKNEMDTECCDFSNVQNSTFKESLDTDMSEFGDSLFNTQIEKAKATPFVARNTSESECEVLMTDQSNSPENIEASAVVSTQFDSTAIKSEYAATPVEQTTSGDRGKFANEIVPIPDMPEATSVESTTSFEPMVTDIESGTIPTIEQHTPPESASDTFEIDSETSIETSEMISEEPASDVYQLPTIVEEADVASITQDSPQIEQNTEESNEEPASDVGQMLTIPEANLTLGTADAAIQIAPNTPDSLITDVQQLPTIPETFESNLSLGPGGAALLIAPVTSEPDSFNTDVQQLPTTSETIGANLTITTASAALQIAPVTSEPGSPITDVQQSPTISASQIAPNIPETDPPSSDYEQLPSSPQNDAKCAATPVERIISEDSEMTTSEIDPKPDMAGATTVESATSFEAVISSIESGTIPIIEQHSLPQGASETVFSPTDSDISTETIEPIADAPVSDVYELPTIPEEPDVIATPIIEDMAQIEQITTESIEESGSDVCQLPTTPTGDGAIQIAPNTTEPGPPITDAKQSPTISETVTTPDASTVESNEPTLNDQPPGIVCSEMAQTNAKMIDKTPEPVISESESESIVMTQPNSPISSAPEIATNENDSVFPCEIAVVAGRSSSDTLSVDTDTASMPASQQSVTGDFSDSVINEIRTQILDDVLKKFNETDQTDSAVPFVDECPVKESNTLDDIEQYIRREQDEEATEKCPVETSSIEIDTPLPAPNTCEPISARFNESQIVSLDYTASGTEILTLDVPISHVSSSTLFEFETSLPLSQFSSDVGEEGDYLLPISQSCVSKIDETISTISFGSSILGTTGSTDRELDSSSSFNVAAVLSDNNVIVDSTPSRATSPPTPSPAASEDNSGEPASEKNGKRKLSIADDYETEFLLSKSRKPEVQSTPFSST